MQGREIFVSEIEIFKPTKEYQRLLSINFVSIDKLLVSKIVVPYQRFVLKAKRNDFVNEDCIPTISVVIPNISVNWDASIKKIEEYLLPFPLFSLSFSTTSHKPYIINVVDLCKVYYLAKKLELTELSFQIQSLCYNCDPTSLQIMLESCFLLPSIKSEISSMFIPILTSLSVHYIEIISDEFQNHPVSSYIEFVSLVRMCIGINSPDKYLPFVIKWLKRIFPSFSKCSNPPPDFSLVFDSLDSKNTEISFLKWAYSRFSEDIDPPNDLKNAIISLDLLKYLKPIDFVVISSLLPFDYFSDEAIEEMLLTISISELSNYKNDILVFYENLIKSGRYRLDLVKDALFSCVLFYLCILCANKPEYIDKLYELLEKVSENKVIQEELLKSSGLFIKNVSLDLIVQVYKPYNNDTECIKESIHILTNVFIERYDHISKNFVDQYKMILDRIEFAGHYSVFLIDFCLKNSLDDYLCLKDRLSVENIHEIIAQLLSYQKLCICYKTIELFHFYTRNDSYSQFLLVLMIRKFSIDLNNIEVLFPLNEHSFTQVLQLACERFLQINRDSMNKIVAMSSIMIDFLSPEEIKLISKLTKRYKHLVYDLPVLSGDEDNVVTLFGHIRNFKCNIPQLSYRVFASHFGTYNQFCFDTSRHLPDMEISISEWMKFCPPRFLYHNCQSLVPNNTMVVVFDFYDEKKLTLIKEVLAHSGFKNINVMFYDQAFNIYPLMDSYIFWKPKNSPIIIEKDSLSVFDIVFHSIPFTISASLLRDFPHVMGFDMNFDDNLEKIEWDVVSSNLLPNKYDLCTYTVHEDIIYNSIPFCVHQSSLFSDQIKWSNGRIFAAVIKNSNASVFNFDICFKPEESTIYYMKSKQVSQCMVSLICAARANKKLCPCY